MLVKVSESLCCMVGALRVPMCEDQTVPVVTWGGIDK